MTRERVDSIDALASEQLALTENAMALVEALDRQANSLRDISDDRAESMEQALEIDNQPPKLSAQNISVSPDPIHIRAVSPPVLDLNGPDLNGQLAPDGLLPAG